MFAFYNNVVEIYIFITQCIQQVLCCKMIEIEPRFLVFCKGFPLKMQFFFLGLANDSLCITVTSLVRTNNKRMRARLKKPKFLIKNHKLGLRYIFFVYLVLQMETFSKCRDHSSSKGLHHQGSQTLKPCVYRHYICFSNYNSSNCF